LYFDQFNLNSCSLLIQGDTISKNNKGGIYLNNGGSKSCPVIIRNNFILSNNTYGAIYHRSGSNYEVIEGNYIKFNSSNDPSYPYYIGIITFTDHASYNS